MLLDLGLPGNDGSAIARQLRERVQCGLIIVTGRGEVLDKTGGREVGADDYVTKPSDLRERVALIKSVPRRIVVDPQGQEVADRRRARPAVRAAASYGPRPFARLPAGADAHREAGPFDRTIDVQIGRLRRKIEADTERPESIKSVRGASIVLIPAVISA